MSAEEPEGSEWRGAAGGGSTGLMLVGQRVTAFLPPSYQEQSPPRSNVPPMYGDFITLMAAMGRKRTLAASASGFSDIPALQ